MKKKDFLFFATRRELTCLLSERRIGPPNCRGFAPRLRERAQLKGWPNPLHMTSRGTSGAALCLGGSAAVHRGRHAWS